MMKLDGPSRARTIARYEINHLFTSAICSSRLASNFRRPIPVRTDRSLDLFLCRAEIEQDLSSLELL